MYMYNKKMTIANNTSMPSIGKAARGRKPFDRRSGWLRKQMNMLRELRHASSAPAARAPFELPQQYIAQHMALQQQAAIAMTMTMAMGMARHAAQSSPSGPTLPPQPQANTEQETPPTPPPTTPTAPFRIPKKAGKAYAQPAIVEASPTMPAQSSVISIDAVQRKELQAVPDRRHVQVVLDNGKTKSLIVDETFPQLARQYRKILTTAEAKKANNSSCNNKQRPKNITFDGRTIPNTSKLLIVDYDADITVTNNHDGETSFVSVRKLDLSEDTQSGKFVQAALEIARRWDISKANAMRSSPKGDMIRLGTRKGAGFHKFFFDKPTKENKDGINESHREANVAAKGMAKKYFPRAYRSIRNAMKHNRKEVHEDLGGKKGLCDDLIQSKNLENEFHVDTDVSEYCFSVWTAEKEVSDPDPEGWYFVMPYLTGNKDGDRYEGIAIRLRHGVGIEWNGRQVFHCSTAPNEQIEVHGTYFGFSEPLVTHTYCAQECLSPTRYHGHDRTTLGADNGLGCAAALALLGADESKVLPPIEALFTVEEETGLYGAADLDVKILGLTGKSMLNLDMEEYGDIFIGCAGGGDSTITLPLSKEVISADLSEIVEIRVEGLLGGHSGLNIHEHRGNAVIICAAAVQSVLEAAGDGGASLLSICGGDKHNAIPREASATLAINPSSRDVVERSVSASAMAAKEEYGLLEKSFKIAMNTKELSGEYHEALTKSSAQTLLAVLLALPHGPIKFSHAIPSLVESSSNLASVSTDRKSNVATILCSSRSSIGTALEATRDKIKAVAYLAGAAVKQSKAYPGWAPNPSSEILEVTKCMFSKKLGRAPGVNAVHAGLECGVLMAKLGKDLDVVSYGPTITGAHSPDEKVDVSTVEPFFEVTEDILKEYAKRR